MPPTPGAPPPPKPGRSGRNALIAMAAVFLSRLAGLARERVFAHYLGNSVAADAFKAALRIPNLLQNLFGEGVLSAAFIPVYARLRAEGKNKEAEHLASVIASLLAVIVSVLVALGVVATPWIIALVAPGFEDARRESTILLVRILFPGTGLLVASAWCLGVLNSHRKFFLSYAAPVLWNAAQIVALIVAGKSTQGFALAPWVAWGAVAGSALQFGVQLPTVFGLLKEFRPALRTTSTHVREVLQGSLWVVFSRGVTQLSAYIDSMLASWLPQGAVAALAYAQILYTLPVSLFGMAVSAAELPELSSVLGKDEEVRAALRERIASAILRIAYFIVPTSVGFLALGDLIAAVLFQTGRFTRNDALWVWSILAGSTVGLVAATLGRLYSSAFYALRDQRTPLRYAVFRLVLTGVLGAVFSLGVPRWLGIAPFWGAAGLSSSAGLAAWVEFLLLRRRLHQRIGRIAGGAATQIRLWLSAVVAAGAAWGIRWAAPHLGELPPVVLGMLVLIPYGLIYLGVTLGLGVSEARTTLQALRRRLRRTS